MKTLQNESEDKEEAFKRKERRKSIEDKETNIKKQEKN